MAHRDRHRPRSRAALRQEGQLLGDGRHRPVRPQLRDSRRSDRGRLRRQSGERRRPARHGDLEPGVHPVQPHRRRRAAAAAGAARGHRHGLRAARGGAAVHGQLRHRRVHAADGPHRRSGRAALRRRRGRTAGGVPGGGRPHAHVEFLDRRWRAALQRGPRLRAAPPAAPRRPLRAPAGHGRAVRAPAGADGGRDIRGAVPGGGGPGRLHRRGDQGRGGELRAHPRARAGDLLGHRAADDGGRRQRGAG